ncbi:MAG: hypothetical protein HETSPECPRED_002582 [Heterodermia speciosa]|uniref:Cyanovirin-N domain-containing protein n=1 Tax=Heterodermia speciosa TaxID=116794 RepID=A0A8H3F0B9_9LECA|nr:MAG: hypothetical protein HETSPECPRED_002582 [Heterodermia speciosa]
MDKRSPQDTLDTIWAGVNVENRKCCYCGTQIDLQSVLARTFCMRSQYVNQASSRDWAQKIDIPELCDQLVVFHRHLQCLFQSTKYVVISHVWHGDVAIAQSEHGISPTRLRDVARTVCNIPALVCRGLAAGLDQSLEVWHDYISVPQWQPDVKHKIIVAIPELFRRAMLTVVYASDLDATNIEMMRSGSSAYDRCRAISKICNIKWFSRVWTAMEYIQSRQFCFMSKEFICLKDKPDDGPEGEHIIAEFCRRWSVEVAGQGSAQAAEKLVDMSQNLVPWQLEPLDQIRSDNMNERDCLFATAHELFARRGITNRRDFFHVLLGTLRTSLTVEMLSDDTPKALMQVARSRLDQGDLSPLFMVPATFQGLPSAKLVRTYGYNDVDSFGLGAQEKFPSHGVVEYNVANNNPVIKAEYIEEIRRVPCEYLFKNIKKTFATLVRHTLKVVSDNMNEFIRTLGVRFLFLNEDPIVIARKCREDSSDPYTIDLKKYLGNDNGYFSPISSKFHLSARAIKVSGTTITAELRAINGQWRSDTIDVRRLIKVCPATEEHLDWVADAMGLSNHALGSEMTPLSPMEFFTSHGATIHSGPRGALLNLTCPSCRQDFLLRGVLYSEKEQGARLTMWRIPGLKYTFTHEGGAGIILNYGRIVGRFLWAPQTCDCPKLADVEVELNDIPIPRANTFNYGGAQ